MLGGLAASGWHTACLVMRMNYDSWLKDTASLGAPGIDELRWVKPVRPGDRLRGRLEILDTRVSKSRPEMGLVGMSCTVENQSGDVVLTQRHTQLIRRRGAAEASLRARQRKPLPAGNAATCTNLQTPPLSGWFEDLTVGTKTSLGQATFTRDCDHRASRANTIRSRSTWMTRRRAAVCLEDLRRPAGTLPRPG